MTRVLTTEYMTMQVEIVGWERAEKEDKWKEAAGEQNIPIFLLCWDENPSKNTKNGYQNISRIDLVDARFGMVTMFASTR